MKTEAGKGRVKKDKPSQCRYCGTFNPTRWLVILDGKPPVCDMCATTYVFTRHEHAKLIEQAEQAAYSKGYNEAMKANEKIRLIADEQGYQRGFEDGVNQSAKIFPESRARQALIETITDDLREFRKKHPGFSQTSAWWQQEKRKLEENEN